MSSGDDPAHLGHQPPRFTAPGTASHSCPFAHRQRKCDLVCLYSSESNRPPRLTASFLSSCNAKSFGSLPTHCGHQLPLPLPSFLKMLAGVASHSCPCLQRQRNSVRLFL